MSAPHYEDRAMSETYPGQCGECHQPATGYAAIGDIRYCREGDSPTCFESAQSYRLRHSANMTDFDESWRP